MNATGLVEEVGVNPLADRGIGTDFGYRAKFQQRFSIRTHHIENRKMRQVNHAHAVTQCKVLRIGDFPEVPVIPLCSTRRHAIAVGLKQRCFIGSVAIGPLPASNFHEVATQRHFALIKRAGAHLPRRRVRLSRVDRWRIDLLRHLVTTVANKLVSQLHGVMPRWVNPMRVHLGATCSHPICQ